MSWVLVDGLNEEEDTEVGDEGAAKAKGANCDAALGEMEEEHFEEVYQVCLDESAVEHLKETIVSKNRIKYINNSS